MDEIDEDPEWEAKRRLLNEIFGRDPDEPEKTWLGGEAICLYSIKHYVPIMFGPF